MAKRKTVLRIEGAEAQPTDESPQELTEEQTAASEPVQQTLAEEPSKVVAETPTAVDAPVEAPRPRTARRSHPAVAVDNTAPDEAAPAPEPARPTVSTADAGKPAQAADKDRSRASALPAPLAWIERLAPGHANAVLGGIAGLLVALMVFIVGFWQTLFVCIFVVIGIAFGQYLDGDPKIINALRRLLSEARGDEQG